MYTDPIEAGYFEKRLQISLDMASRAVNAGAILAHRGLVSCYRAKLASLLRVGAPAARNVVSLNAYRDKKSAQAMSGEPLSPAIGVSTPFSCR
ncbi:hypothetical protein BH09PSE3_BH09PSE3_10390 [soil metagenome]